MPDSTGDANDRAIRRAIHIGVGAMIVSVAELSVVAVWLAVDSLRRIAIVPMSLLLVIGAAAGFVCVMALRGSRWAITLMIFGLALLVGPKLAIFVPVAVVALDGSRPLMPFLLLGTAVIIDVTGLVAFLWAWNRIQPDDTEPGGFEVIQSAQQTRPLHSSESDREK